MNDRVRVVLFSAASRHGQRMCKALDADKRIELVAEVDPLYPLSDPDHPRRYRDPIYMWVDRGPEVMIDATDDYKVRDNVNRASSRRKPSIIGKAAANKWFSKDELEKMAENNSIRVVDMRDIEAVINAALALHEEKTRRQTG